MFKLPFDIDLDITPVLGQDVSSLVEWGIPPVKAVVVDPRGPGGGMPVVEVTFFDDVHAKEWMASFGIDDEDMDWHLGQKVAA
jgi:hypothetical protein